MEYETMTRDELAARLAELTVEFDEYKPIYAEAYNNLIRISDEADKIKKELEKR